MKYCYNCGSKIEPGDMFCTSCGTKLEEEPSSSKDTKRKYLNERDIPHKAHGNYENFKSSINFGELTNVLFKMLLKPIEGAEYFVKNCEKGIVIGVTLFVVLFQGILGVWKVNQVISTLEKISIEFMKKIVGIINVIDPGSASGVLNSDEIMEITNGLNKIKSFIDLSYGKIFLQNCIEILAIIAVLFAVMYIAINIVSKDKVSSSDVYKTTVISMVPLLYFKVFSIIISYVSFDFGIITLLLGILISFACLTITVREVLNVNRNHCVFIVSASFIVIFSVVLICVQKILASNIYDMIMNLAKFQ